MLTIGARIFWISLENWRVRPFSRLPANRRSFLEITLHVPSASALRKARAEVLLVYSSIFLSTVQSLLSTTNKVFKI